MCAAPLQAIPADACTDITSSLPGILNGSPSTFALGPDGLIYVSVGSPADDDATGEWTYTDPSGGQIGRGCARHHVQHRQQWRPALTAVTTCAVQATLRTCPTPPSSA
jgi:hypothetical protein